MKNAFESLLIQQNNNNFDIEINKIKIYYHLNFYYLFECLFTYDS